MALQKYKRNSEFSYALGATLVAELLSVNPSSITRVFLRPTQKHGDNLDAIITKLKQHHIEIIESTKAFNILGAKDNCLLAAEFKKAPTYEDKTPSNRSIILVNPSDSGNLGTIMRSAIAFGFDTIHIVTPAVDPYDPKVVRASMGALFHLHIHLHNNYDWLKADNSTFAFILDKNARELSTVEPSDACTLIFGNEASGLPQDFAKQTGATPIYIHQSAKVDSLNLSIAASIAMHHFAKQD